VIAMNPRENRRSGKNARNMLNAIAWQSVRQSGKIRVHERIRCLQAFSVCMGELYGGSSYLLNVLYRTEFRAFYCRREHSGLNCGWS
jgi:hypothetical protein